MDKGEVKRIDIKQVLRQKAPRAARKIPGFVVDYLIRTVHQEEINDILARYHGLEGVDFMQALIGYFDLTLDVRGEMPGEGRFIFASNHPLGGLDGICLSALIGEAYGGKIRYLVNDLLLYLENLKSIFVPINKHGAQGKENARLIEEAYMSENQVITFPAGLCSRRIQGKVVDLEWKKSGHPIQAGCRAGLFRRRKLRPLLPAGQPPQGVGHPDELRDGVLARRDVPRQA